MLKSEMRHQFWITKKTVQQKLGTKEDEHIISSDAELDTKIEIFKSITETSSYLKKVIDQYQERLCILSQEECLFGRFMKEAGKRSKTTGLSITNTGKAVSYSGQQRMCIRVPLLRLQHEVEVFRQRAVRDTQETIQSMEKERTEYRAALSWIKSVSSQLDPDTGKGLDNFRMAQSHVRAAKRTFDGLSMDSIQKIDLLAAARCNMFSHALMAYISEFKHFANKSANTFQAISKSLQMPKFDFYILKDLSQSEGTTEGNVTEEVTAIDKDRTTFFSREYSDERKYNISKEEELSKDSIIIDNNNEDVLIEFFTDMKDTPKHSGISSPVSECTTDNWSNVLTKLNITNDNASLNEKPTQNICDSKIGKCTNYEKIPKTSKANTWMNLFAELDPLVNPEAFDFRLTGGRYNFQQT